MGIQEIIKIKLNSGKMPTLNELIKQVDKYEVVSFDIFDTLLKRNIGKPSDVFMYMEKKYNVPGFAKKRILAENIARQHKPGKEILLTDIYAYLGNDLSKEELQSEALFLTANESIREFYKYCIRNKIVILISDMYLSQNFIEEILEREGYAGYKKIYISSSIGVCKNTGDLFKSVAGELGGFESWIHIGDSWNSDYKMPKSLGIKSIHIPKIIESDTFAVSGESIPENILNAFLKNSFLDNKDLYYRFGYERFGMFLWGYACWLHKKFQEEGIRKAFFFARDGLVMKNAFDSLFGDITTEYLEVSRRSLRVPILWKNYSFQHIMNMISPSKLVTIKNIFDGVGLNIEQYEGLLEKYHFSSDTAFDRSTIKDNQILQCLYRELEQDIETNSRREYELAAAYLQQQNVEGKFAVIDIGWSGGMQRYLMEILSSLGITHNIKGYYVGVADYYKRNVDVVSKMELNGYLFDFFHNSADLDRRRPFVGLFESLFLEQGGSVEKYRRDGEKVTAVRYPYEYMENGTPTHEYRCVEKIQAGALDFINNFRKYEVEISADKLFSALEEFGEKPTRRQVDLFSNFRFFDEGEITKLADPKGLFFYLVHPQLLKTDFLHSRWKIGFMKKLFKLDLPYKKLFYFLDRFK